MININEESFDTRSELLNLLNECTAQTIGFISFTAAVRKRGGISLLPLQKYLFPADKIMVIPVFCNTLTALFSNAPLGQANAGKQRMEPELAIWDNMTCRAALFRL